MNEFMRQYWPNYVFPVGAPLVVCIASFFGTNIGWTAFPLAIVLCSLMAYLTTLKIRSHERDIEKLITAIKAAGKVTVVNNVQR